MVVESVIYNDMSEIKGSPYKKNMLSLFLKLIKVKEILNSISCTCVTDKIVAQCKSATMFALCKVINFSVISVTSIMQYLMNACKQKLLLTRTEIKLLKKS